MRKLPKYIKYTAFFTGVLLLIIMLSACQSYKSSISYTFKEMAGSNPPETCKSGFFSLLTYNIAGLPDFISKSNPSHNTKIISRLVNRFDIVLLQEDFYYHDELLKYSEHPYRSEKSNNGPFFTGDGLNRLSRFPFYNYGREEWKKRYGILSNDSDTLAPKGFSFAQHEVYPGILVDIYNLHMDAGHGQGDFNARRSEMKQLTSRLKENKSGNAIILAGDWNIKRNRSEDSKTLDMLTKGLGFMDVRVFLNIPGDRIDKVLFKNGDKVKLVPVTYQVHDRDFMDEEGKPLSDHDPVSVTFEWNYCP